MSETIDIQDYLKAPSRPTIDVRSPSEFAAGHIPDAVNIPLFSDSERAEVGIAYKNQGRNHAIGLGLRLVGGKADSLLQSLSQFEEGEDVFIHCWRGGMRSEAFNWLACRTGLVATRIVGGYKAFRRAAHESFAEPMKIVILSGYTGVGKTALLQDLQAAGEQVIDLESLACHRGSAFGGIGQPPQPTVEQFENALFESWRTLDWNRPVWLEDESQSIGRVNLPLPLWNQMRAAPGIFATADRESRIELLVREYGDLPANALGDAIGRVKKRLGGLRYQQAMAALEENQIGDFADIALRYYDDAYTTASEKRPRGNLVKFKLKKAGVAEPLDDLRDLGHRLMKTSE
ncbi:MAG: tRNA 2-selenouridine(34) synthase MnmH [Rubripirellula sp.]